MISVYLQVLLRYWITNGAVHAKHVVVMAQLLVNGKNEVTNRNPASIVT